MMESQVDIEKQKREEEEKEQLRLERIESELFFSIDKNDPDRLRRLLAEGIDPNTSFCGIDPLGKSLFWCPLHFCCEKGRYQCAQLLLEAGANPDAGDRWCMTPLMYAIQTEWFDLAELLISAGASVDLQDSRGRTPLSLAVECSDDTAVRMLCDAGADVNAQDLVGRTPAWLAVCKDGHVTQLRALLNNKYHVPCDLDVADLREKRTAIQAAIVYSQVDRLEYVRMLLAAGSDVNNRDEANHNTMLNLLAKSKRLGHTKVNTEELSVARLLVDAGYKLNEVPFRSCWYKYGGTALKMAAEQGATEIVELFLDRGGDPDLPDDCGVTPLLAAVINNHIDTCLLLIRSNCLIDVTGDVKLDGIQRQLTPLQAAVIKGHFTLARLLIAVGASTTSDKYLCDSSGAVPAHLVGDEACLFWQWLMDWVSNPSALSDLCIHKLRNVLRRPLQDKLSVLPLPTFLRHCILLDHILPEFHLLAT